jgi:hypothetical protein
LWVLTGYQLSTRHLEEMGRQFVAALPLWHDCMMQPEAVFGSLAGEEGSEVPVVTPPHSRHPSGGSGDSDQEVEVDLAIDLNDESGSDVEELEGPEPEGVERVPDAPPDDLALAVEADDTSDDDDDDDEGDGPERDRHGMASAGPGRPVPETSDDDDVGEEEEEEEEEEDDDDEEEEEEEGTEGRSALGLGLAEKLAGAEGRPPRRLTSTLATNSANWHSSVL